MNKNQAYEQLAIEPQLEIVEMEIDTDHSRLMKAYEKLEKNIDFLIEKKRIKK